ncbi:MAG: potassium channel family protein [Candidatus Acetothermia bacterium]
MRIIIVGLGNIGLHLAERINPSSKHELFLIDTDQDKCDQLMRELDAAVITGDGTDPEVLKKSEVRDADLLLASTGTDPINLIVGLLGLKYSVPHVVIKLANGDLEETCYEVGVSDVIMPDMLGLEDLEIKIDSWAGTENAGK